MARPERILLHVFVSMAIATSASCGRQESGAPARDSAPVAAASVETPPITATSNRPRIVALGDSLTAGLGLHPSQAYPALLQATLEAAGLGYDVVNAGVSGDTSAGGLRRLDWALDGDVRVLIVALGGNDGLRGLPPEALRANLASIVERARARDIAVVIAGMEAPPNMGPAYTASFRAVYPDLAREYGVTLIPFLLADVAGIDALNQSDGIHPNPEGARIVADHVLRAVRPLLDRPTHPS